MERTETYCPHGYAICFRTEAGHVAHDRAAIALMTDEDIAEARANCAHVFAYINNEHACLGCGQTYDQIVVRHAA